MKLQAFHFIKKMTTLFMQSRMKKENYSGWPGTKKQYHSNFGKKGDYEEPKGITFDSLGNLYISNEGDDFSEGNILRFDRKLIRLILNK
jgi:hypothetical protein